MKTSLSFAGCVAFALMCLLCTRDALRSEESPEPKVSPGSTAEKKPPIPEIPKEKLPPQTRAKPDPLKLQYQREPVFVRVDEQVTQLKGKPFTPPICVTGNYLKEYLRRAGHPIVEERSAATYKVEGTVEVQSHSEIIVLDRVVGWKYRAAAKLRVLDKDDHELEKCEVPEIFQEDVKSEESAVLNVRRYLAKLLWDNLSYKGSTFASKKFQALINLLVVEDCTLETKEVSIAEPFTTEKVVNALADMGLEVVPRLIDALTDQRPVRIASSYPKLAGRPLDSLKVYHVADKALEEIFQKISRMSLDTTPEERYAVIRGWENEWKRFCPSYRESPSGRAKPKEESPKKP